MAQKAGAQIGRKAFVQSAVILLTLMIAAGALTRIVPAGRYARIAVGEREVIDPASFELITRPDYPVWRWFTAPVEVLGGPDGAITIVVIAFILMVGSAFAVLDKSGILRASVARVVKGLGGRKYLLLLIISFFFMAVGAFFGIFEEIVPLVPVMIALSYSLGWDSLVGLGMSILATNLGFSAAITNPFTIGVAQELAGLPLFSGAGLRTLIFGAIYTILAVFLVRYARSVECNPESSPVFEEDTAERAKYESLQLMAVSKENPRLGKAIAWFLAFFVLIVAVLVSGPFAPAIPLILMAASVKHIVAQGGIMDTILHSASLAFAHSSPFAAALTVYALALVIEFFVASGSAKAFLLMPILLPLADLIGVTRQVTVTAYCFGDGFSNLAYPTNPVLLICLGLTVISYAQWIKWSLKLWFWVILASTVFLGLAVAIGFGPF